jgi:hypothetical protein
MEIPLQLLDFLDILCYVVFAIVAVGIIVSIELK